MNSFFATLPFIMVVILAMACVIFVAVLRVNNKCKHISKNMDYTTGLRKHTTFLNDVKKELSDNPIDKYALVYIHINDFDDVVKALDLNEYETVLKSFADMLVRAFGEGNIHGRSDGASFESLIKYANVVEIPSAIESLRGCLKNKSGFLGDPSTLNFQVGIYLIDSEQTRIPAEEMCQCASVALQNIMSQGLGYSFFKHSMLRDSQEKSLKHYAKTI